MGTLCNYDYHVQQIKSPLDRVALLRGTFEMNQSATGHINPKTLILIWDTGGSCGLTPFKSDFIDYFECDIDVRDVTKVNKVIGIGTTLHKLLMILATTSTCRACLTIFQRLMSGYSLLKYTIKSTVVTLLLMQTKLSCVFAMTANSIQFLYQLIEEVPTCPSCTTRSCPTK